MSKTLEHQGSSRKRYPVWVVFSWMDKSLEDIFEPDILSWGSGGICEKEIERARFRRKMKNFNLSDIGVTGAFIFPSTFCCFFSIKVKKNLKKSNVV
jgi:hypothetical protein